MLYGKFYHLEREPFSLSPDPSFMYLAPTHREAMAQLRYAVESRKGFAVLTGEVGTGKTTLLRNLLESVGPKIQTAYVLSPPHTRAELYIALASELGLQMNGSETWFLTLHRFLLDANARGDTVVALFDEAQNIPVEVLEEIRLLTNLETSRTKLLQVILAGQPELDRLLDSNELRALRQRISLRHSLSPLEPDETTQYIANRLKLAGADHLPFDADACHAIHQYSLGIPRIINLLCDSSLIAGYAGNQETIDAKMVKSIAEDARLVSSSKRDQGVFNAPVAKLTPPATGETPPLIEENWAEYESMSARPWPHRNLATVLAATIVVSLSFATLCWQFPNGLPTLVDQVQSFIETAFK